jgi:hypothetical protein
MLTYMQDMLKKYHKKKLVIHFKVKYLWLFLLANIIAFSHLNLTNSIPKFKAVMKLNTVKNSAPPLGYYSEEILDGMYDYRLLSKSEFLELVYPKKKNFSYDDFLLISKNTRLEKFSSNGRTNRIVVARGDSEEKIMKNIIYFVNVNYEHFYKNYYIKRKKFINDKISFIELLKNEFDINLNANSLMVNRAISKLVESEMNYKVLKKLFFTDVVAIEHIIEMPNTVVLELNKAKLITIFIVYNLIAILLIIILLTLQLFNLNIKSPKLQFKFN